MTQSGTIKMWVAAMLAIAFVAGGTTFLFLGRLVAQVPPPNPGKIDEFRKQWVATYHPSQEQVDAMDHVLRTYQDGWQKILDEMYQKYRPQFAKMQSSADKDLDALLTPEQCRIRDQELERRRRRSGGAPSEGR